MVTERDGAVARCQRIAGVAVSFHIYPWATITLSSISAARFDNWSLQLENIPIWQELGIVTHRIWHCL